jgi:hypothetical protein
MKRITFNIDDELFEKLGGDKTKANKQALKLLLQAMEAKPVKEVSKEHWIIETIKGYLKDEDHVYLEVLSNRHGRRSRRIKMDDL